MYNMPVLTFHIPVCAPGHTRMLLIYITSRLSHGNVVTLHFLHFSLLLHFSFNRPIYLICMLHSYFLHQAITSKWAPPTQNLSDSPFDALSKHLSPIPLFVHQSIKPNGPIAATSAETGALQPVTSRGELLSSVSSWVCDSEFGISFIV